MVKNLQKAGFAVTVHDNDSAKLREFGNSSVSDQQGLLPDCTHIITMLPNNDIVRHVYLKEGMMEKATSGTTFIDCSTVSPDVPRSIAKEYRLRGLNFIDAPVSGGVKGAQLGTLSFLVGGSKQVIDSSRELFQAMGKKVFVCGEVGSGQVAKICNNLILGVSMVALSESMNLAIRLGLDPKIFVDILNASSGRSWACETYVPVPGVMEGTPACSNYNGGFATRLLSKDLGLALEEAKKMNAPLPMTCKAQELYKQMMNELPGMDGKDFSAIYSYLAQVECK